MTTQRMAGGEFGELLRYWRGVRRVSQLDLSVEADISTRHLSFLETGRSRPSREMVQRLAGVLSLPLREKNELLTAAGFARMHRESGLTEPALARYRYGSAFVDALNRTVYAVTLTSPARTWKGIRPGVAEDVVRSMLSLLGTPEEPRAPARRAPVQIGGYQVYTTPEDRPRRTLVTPVRPPNGCYDVVVELVPRIIGRLATDEAGVVVVARRGAPMTWAVDLIRVVSRALPGPYAGDPVCDPTLPIS